MRVQVIWATPDPVGVIAYAAGVCYGKRDRKPSRVRNCIERGHLGVLEHVSVSFLVEGVSRACTHQLVRHRLASYDQESQRYVKLDADGDWYVTPPTFINDKRDTYSDLQFFRDHMEADAEAYEIAVDVGIPPEDARYLLPNAAKTSIVVTRNFRDLLHFLKLRTASDAQWEIRDLANAMVEELRAYDPEWEKLLDMAKGVPND